MGIWFSSGAKAQTSGSCGLPGCDTNLLTALLHSLTRVPELPAVASPVGESSLDEHKVSILRAKFSSATQLRGGSRNCDSGKGRGDLERTSVQLECLYFAQVFTDGRCVATSASLSESCVIAASVQVTSLCFSLGMNTLRSDGHRYALESRAFSHLPKWVLGVFWPREREPRLGVWHERERHGYCASV